jgi:hypothetical protein
MATNYCKNCGANLSPESKFCENCGQPVDASPNIKQESYIAPQAAAPSLTPSSRLGAAFWLGLIGAVIGMLIGALLLTDTTHIISGLGLVIFSLLAIIGGLRLIEDRDNLNASLMILAGAWALLCVVTIPELKYFGFAALLFISFLFFILGGVLIYLKKG